MNLPFFHTPHGRHMVSFWASKLFEKSGMKKLFGLNLVAAVIFTGVITPEATDVYNQLALEEQVKETPIAAEATTKSTYELPLADFHISQLFSFWHPGLDMVAAAGTPIYAIEAGEIKEVNNTFFGYGKHILIEHGHKVKTLYAHLSEFQNVFVGKHVARGELIGYVGSTGWSTGNHLHLEIYIDGLPVNPMELLSLTPDAITYEAAIYETAAPAATSILSSSPLPFASALPTALPVIASPGL